MTKATPATLLAVCAALTACDSASTRDLTAPNARGASLATAAVGPGSRSVIRPDGSVSLISATRTSLRALGGGVSAAASGTTTQCDNAVITVTPGSDPDIDITVPFSGTYDNVEVPPNGVCVLSDATVTGWVRALAGSHLFIHTSQVGGNVEGVSAKTVQLQNESTVGGNMDVRDAAGDPYASCAVGGGSTISGNLSCTGNDPGSPIVRGDPFIPPTPGDGDEDEGDPGQPERRNTVGGSVNLERNSIPPGNVMLLQLTNVGVNADVNKNTGGGFKSVDNNTVVKTLECKKNDLPFVGGPNVANKTKGQCF